MAWGWFFTRLLNLIMVQLVTEHESLGAVVDLGRKKVGFNKSGNLIDLSTAHIINELPEAMYRNTNNITLEEAANAFVQKRNPRWNRNSLNFF